MQLILFINTQNANQVHDKTCLHETLPTLDLFYGVSIHIFLIKLRTYAKASQNSEKTWLSRGISTGIVNNKVMSETIRLSMGREIYTN